MSIDETPNHYLSLEVSAKMVPLFFQLLGHGFRLNVQTGCSVKELLCVQLGIHEDYVTQRIQTIFLNAKVVDEADAAIVHDDATLALSGAMPGLVGAILRSGGFYAPMRSQISHEMNSQSSDSATGKITLKLWNLVVKELGPTFLERGVWVQGKEVQLLIERHWESLKTGYISAKLADNSISPEHLKEMTWETNLIFLQVIPSEGS